MFSSLPQSLPSGSIHELLFNLKKNVFSNNSFGIVHIGANKGQERFFYDKLDLNVVWIEANPEVANILQNNVKDYPKQTAYQGLITDEVGKHYDFKITNNSCSSTLFDFDVHLEIYPHVHQVNTIGLISTTLNQFTIDKCIDISLYKVLLLDVEGSELLVLKGAGNILSNFDFIITEAMEYKCYKDGYTVKDMESYLHKMGFLAIERILQDSHPKGNSYDILYKNFK